MTDLRDLPDLLDLQDPSDGMDQLDLGSTGSTGSDGSWLGYKRADWSILVECAEPLSVLELVVDAEYIAA